jgi:hypothetical protein
MIVPSLAITRKTEQALVSGNWAKTKETPWPSLV